MCGICGYTGIHDDGLLRQMTESLSHRGPDGEGYFLEHDVGLGHRRLSIIDVAGGQQPMENEDGSLVLVCNGEFYNYRQLQQQLLSRGHVFRTRSDSEVALHLYEELGPACLEQLRGMFALAIYEKRSRRLFVARDRLGIKPLYYACHAGRFLFASEIKALFRYDGLSTTLNPSAVHDYLALRYVPGPGGMLAEAKKLPAAHYALVQDGQATVHRYWQPELCHGPFARTEEAYQEGFAELFEETVRAHMVSDVPVGAFLSGGIDSSTIVAAMAQLTSTPVRTFTVGFGDRGDELSEAAETARRLGCRHTEVACRPADVELLPRIVYHLDEPLGDPIVIPMYQLAREAKRHVTVVLTGEGADETMGGYVFHKALLSSHRLSRVVPRFLRSAVLSPALAALPASLLNLAFDYPAKLGRRGKQKVCDYLDLVEPHQLPQAYRHLISLFDQRDTEDLYTDEFRLELRNGPAPVNGHDAADGVVPYLNRILHLQFPHWLPDNILTKQDKMTMAHGLEARVPFMDHELVEYALRLPPALKIRGGRTKYVLRRYAARLLPRRSADRPKVPFHVPIAKYLSEPVFRELMHDTLSDSAVRARGILRPDTVRRLCQSMHRGEFMYVKQVFSLIVLELWFRMAIDRRFVA